MWEIKQELIGTNPDNKIHGANMGPTWGQQDPGGPHVGHVNRVIWEVKQHQYHAYIVCPCFQFILKFSIIKQWLHRQTVSFYIRIF